MLTYSELRGYRIKFGSDVLEVEEVRFKKIKKFQILKITKYAVDKNVVHAFLYSLKDPDSDTYT